MEAGEEEGGREVCFYAGKESFFLSFSLFLSSFALFRGGCFSVESRVAREMLMLMHVASKYAGINSRGQGETSTNSNRAFKYSFERRSRLRLPVVWLDEGVINQELSRLIN